MAVSPGDPYQLETATGRDAEVTAEPVESPVLPGETLQGYKVLERVGGGGMGVVYKAVDTRLGRHVALKFLPRDADPGEGGGSALMNEARAASALDHPNIGAIYGVEETSGGQRFIVMAYYEGQTLAQKLRSGPLPVSEAAAIAMQIAHGLAEAHEHRIVHRDIKPSNIFLTRQGLVKILDFGIARVIRSADSTRSANISGTVAYMSPEQAEGKPLDGRTDLWSLGAVIYEMVEGRRAFEAAEPAATLFAIVNGPAPELKGDVPPAVQKIIYHALAKKVEERYQSAVEMIQDLRPVCGGEGQGSAPTITLEEVGQYAQRAGGFRARKRWWRRRWVAALAVAVVLAGAAEVRMRLNAPKPAAYEMYLKGVEYARQYDKPESLDRAIALFKDSVKADPNFALAFASLGHAYWQKSALTHDRSLLGDAEANSRRALQLNESLPWVHIVMGQIQRSLGNLDLAHGEFQRALQREPANIQAMFGLAGLYGSQGRLQDAEELYRRAVKLRPDSWETYNYLGVFLKGQRRFADAAGCFRRVIQLNPNGVAGYLNLSSVLIDDGKLDEAEGPLRDAARHDPSSYTVPMALGALYYRKRLFGPAADATMRALQLDNRDWQAWKNLALIYRWMNDDGRAVAAYQHALPLLEGAARISPQNALLQARLAEVYAYCGKREESESRIQTALALARDAPVLISCADASAAMGDLRRAVALANEAITNGLTQVNLDQDPEARRFRDNPGLNLPRR